MELKRFFNVYIRFQLSLNWSNIIFKYFLEIILLFNLTIIFFGIAHKYSYYIEKFKFSWTLFLLIDLFLKTIFKKKQPDFQLFYIIPNGKTFLSIRNILLDVFSIRNLPLPLFAILLFIVLKQQTNFTIFSLFLLSCSSNLIANHVNKTKKWLVLIIAFVSFLMLAGFALHDTTNNICSVFIFFLFIYYRFWEKIKIKENTFSLHSSYSKSNIGNVFLWLDFLILKKSRHLQLTFIKLLPFYFLYGSLIYKNHLEKSEVDFAMLFFIQVYYTFCPAILIPYVLSSNYSYFGLILTMPDLKLFFLTKLKVILIFQLLIASILSIAFYDDIQLLFVISSLGIFNNMVVTPLIFLGVLQTDEKLNVFDTSLSNLLFVPSFGQSVYIFIVTLVVLLLLYLLQFISVTYLPLILLVLSIITYTLRKRCFRFFLLQYYHKKYKLYKILS